MTRISALFLLAILIPAFVFGADYFKIYKEGIRLEKLKEFKLARETFLTAASLESKPRVIPNPEGQMLPAHYDPYAHLAFCEISLGMLDEATTHLQMSKDAGVTPAAYTNRLEWMLINHKAHPMLGQRNKGRKQGMGTPPTDTQEPSQALEPPPDAESASDATPQPAESAQPPPAATATPVSHAPQKEKTPPKEESASPPAPVPASTPVNSPGPTLSSSTNPQSDVSNKPHPNPPAPPVMQGPRIGRIAVLALALVLVGAVLYAWTRKKDTAPSATNTVVSQPAAQAPLRTGNPRTLADYTPTEFLPVEDVVPEETAKRTPTGVTPPAVPLEEALALAKPLPEGQMRDFGGYRLEGVLGTGGMGTTYLAVRNRDQWTVALKIPHEHLMNNEDFVRRFVREGSLGALLHHPNIVRIYESGQVSNRPFIAMELLQGDTLQKKLKEHITMPITEALEITREIALALDYASLKGVVHRDLKPENIMLLERGGLKVMDFGIARLLTAAGGTISDYYLGTPTYSAPEASAPGGTDHRSDLYSLGIILYRMLSGQVPFQSQDPVAILEMHRSQPLPRFSSDLKIPENVSALLDKLTAKKREDRYQNAESFLVDLNTILHKLT